MILTKLFSGNALADSPVPEFKSLLAQLGTILERSGQAPHAAKELPPPEFKSLLAQLSAILERSGQAPRVARELPLPEAGQAQNFVAVRDELLKGAEALRAQVQAMLQGVPIEGRDLPDGGPAQELKGVREKLEALRAYGREALPGVEERLPAAGEAEGGERQKLQLLKAVGEWMKHKRAQDAEGVEPVQDSESLPSTQDAWAFLRPLIEGGEPLYVAAQPDLPPAAAESLAQSFAQINALESPTPRADLPLAATPGKTSDSDQLALDLVSLKEQKPQPVEARAKGMAEPAASAPLVKGEAAFVSPADRSPHPELQASAESLLKPTSGEPSFSAAELRPELAPPSGPGAAFGIPSVPAPAGGENRPALALPVGHPQWADELGQRLIWMHGKAIQAAEIHLNPPHLGPVAVRIEMHDDQASIQFASPHAAVREAIEAALPRLKELLDAHGLPVSQVEVAYKSLDSHAHGERSSASAYQEYQTTAEDKAEEPEQAALRLEVPLGSRLLSLYV
jgi:flagellar hook-length control protein FliK